MYRRFKVMRIICNGHKLARATILILTFITTVSMLWVLPMRFIGRSRHAAWSGSGLDNAAFFTRNFRFDWYGFDDVPPAYGRLINHLNDMDGCTATSVDYCDIYFADDPEPVVLCIYPEILRETIRTPLSEGTFESAEGSEALPLVLDSRLRNAYEIGDKIPVLCAWDGNTHNEIETIAIVTGFLSSDNDHISTLGGSSTQMLRYFAAKAMDGDSYIALVSDGSIFKEKAYTGDCSSVLLLPPKGEPVSQYIDGWRNSIAQWNLGQIDSYQEIYESDLWGMAVIGNIDYYLLTAWLMILTIASLAGYNLMQTDYLRRRLALFGMLGMTKGRMLSYIAVGGYLPFWLVNFLGLLVGNAIAITLYLNYRAVVRQLTMTTLLVTMLPHLLALCVDGIRIMRMDVLKQWNARR
ncbi:MAG: hypothetical protein VB115_09320 [Christensenellaceae bacterium]|nr:hypothetical protein [Christensenellaceae bacterium]